MRVWPWSADPPLDSCGLAWAEATRRLSEGKILLSTGGRPLFSVVMTLPGFFFLFYFFSKQRTRYLKAAAAAAWDYSTASWLCKSSSRLASPLLRRGDTRLDRRRAVAAFSSEVLSLRGGYLAKFAAKRLQLQRSRHESGARLTPQLHAKELASEWCQSGGANATKLCLLDVKPQPLYICPVTFAVCRGAWLINNALPQHQLLFSFWENKCVTFFVTSTFSPIERRTSG